MRRLLVIAGSDSSGGAGIQADLKTAQAFGVYAQTAITAVTVQDTNGVRSVNPVAPCIVREQIEAALGDIGDFLSSASRGTEKKGMVTLKIKPSILIGGNLVKYPGFITIDKEVSSKILL